MTGNAAFTDKQVRNGLGVSILASSLGVLHYGLLVPGGLLATGFLLWMGVSKFLVAALAVTLPLSRFAEILGSWVVQRTGRRRQLFFWAHVASRLLWVPIVLIPSAIGAEHDVARLAALFALLFSSSLLASAGANAWLSWMGDLIPGDVRGRYFGTRQIFEVSAMLLGGLAVGWFMGGAPDYARYLVVFPALVAFGIADILLFRWVPHPEAPPRPDGASVRELLFRPLRDPQYRRLIFFLVTWMIASEMFGPFMWIFVSSPEYLNLSYLTGFAIMAVSGVCRVGTSYFWGYVADRWSPKKVLTLCVIISLTPPFYYLFATRDFTLPLYLAWGVGSLAWSGIGVLTFQYTISMAPARERSMYLACHSAIMGLVSAAGYLAAVGIVWLLRDVHLHVGPWVWCDLQILFCLTGLGRIVSLYPLSRMTDTQRS